MMEFESIVDVQMGAMLEGIEQDRDQRRSSIVEQARAEARKRLREARRRARQQMSAAVAEEKDQWYSSIGRARAALASRLRRRQQELDRGQLVAGEARLREALLSRWQDPEARREWATALLRDAVERLPTGDWHIYYPVSLPKQEAAEILALSGNTGAIRLEASEDLQAGFRLQCGNACLDMTIAGLLAETGAIAGELLAEIHRQQSAGVDE